VWLLSWQWAQLVELVSVQQAVNQGRFYFKLFQINTKNATNLSTKEESTDIFRHPQANGMKCSMIGRAFDFQTQIHF